MTGTIWQVWSVDVGAGMAGAVAEGAEAEMVEAAGTKNLAAERHAPGLVFMALPGDQQPSFEAAQALLLERDGAAPLPPAEREDPAVSAEITGQADGPFSPAAAWEPVLMDLLELDMNGQLAGVRAIVAELLGMVRAGNGLPDDPAGVAASLVQVRLGPWRQRAAAMLAADISRDPP